MSEWPNTLLATFYPHVAPTGYCGYVGCAMGLADHLGIVDIYDGYSSTEQIAEALAIPFDVAMRVFNPGATGGNAKGYGDVAYSEVTAAMVAGKLEAELVKL